MNTKETLSLLAEVRQEISVVNTNAGETIFNPALTSELDALLHDLAGSIYREDKRRQSYSPIVQQKLKEAEAKRPNKFEKTFNAIKAKGVQS